MQWFGPTDRIRAICFDIDKTLYTNDAYADSQIAVLVRRLGDHFTWSAEEAERRVARARADIEAAGGTASLGNAFLSLGISIEQSVLWREELIHPNEYLEPDPELYQALASLSSAGFTIAALTNNPIAVGNATLEVLGVYDCFTVVCGLDSTLRSKPDPAPFRWTMDRLGVEPRTTLFVGDRYGVDIEPALAFGAAGLLIESVKELYTLPQSLGLVGEPL